MNNWLYPHIVFSYIIQILKSCKIIFMLFILFTTFVKNPNLLLLCVCCHVWLFATTGAVGHAAPLSIRLPRQEHWSGLLFSPLRDIPNPGIRPMSPESPVLACRYFTTEPPAAAAAAESLQSCPTLCDPIGGSPPGSPVLKPTGEAFPVSPSFWWFAGDLWHSLACIYTTPVLRLHVTVFSFWSVCLCPNVPF